MPQRNRASFSSNQFLFVLDDGAAEAGFIRAVSGGSVVGDIVEEGLGSDLLKAKHVGVLRVEPIKLEVGMAMARPILEWIKESWEKGFSRHNGEIIHADSNYRARMSQEFQDALLVETKFPDLDASKKDPTYLEVQIQPEQVRFRKGDDNQLRAPQSSKQKMWTAANFDLDIEGVDCSGVSRIESFTVQQNVKQFHYGTGRFPEIEPTGLDFGNLILYASLSTADDFLSWFDEYVLQGEVENVAEKTGTLRYLDQSCAKTLFSLDLYGLGIHSFQIDASTSEDTGIKRVKIELYVESMKLEFGDGM